MASRVITIASTPSENASSLALVIPDGLRWARPIAVVVTAPGRRWPCGTSRLTRRAGRSWDVRAWSRSPDERRPPTVVWAMAPGILTPSTWRGTGASRGKAGFVEHPLEQGAHGVLRSADV